MTGEPADPRIAPRPALIVKIDNAPAALPHVGLERADIVVEEEVEGGTSRLAAVFHSRDAVLGPVRSFRSTDLGLIGPLGAPLIGYSGANQVFLALLAESTAVDRGVTTTRGYWRQRGRRAPHNLFSDTVLLRSFDDPPSDPAPWFVYDLDGTNPPPVAPTDHLELTVGRTPVRWDRDGEGWLRSQRGRPHLTTAGPVRAANVVVMEVDHIDSGLVDSGGSVVPEAVMVGTGRAVILTAGGSVEATWTRPGLTTPATLTVGEGEPVALAPGTTWIELVRR